MGEIWIDKMIHHIGDEDVAGWQPREGSVWQKDFYLNEVIGDAVLVVEVYHTQAQYNEVLINGSHIDQHLFQNPILAYVPCSLRIPKAALQVGKNTLTIKAGQLPHANVDNFLIRNIKIVQEKPVREF